MKRFKNKILSLLLFTFAFFVMHDYVMLRTSEHLQSPHCEVAYESDISSGNIEKNSNEELHDTLHAMLEVCLNPREFINLPSLHATPHIDKWIHFSKRIPSFERPPTV